MIMWKIDKFIVLSQADGNEYLNFFKNAKSAVLLKQFVLCEN